MSFPLTFLPGIELMYLNDSSRAGSGLWGNKDEFSDMFYLGKSCCNGRIVEIMATLLMKMAVHAISHSRFDLTDATTH